jgi:hypothetical protein
MEELIKKMVQEKVWLVICAEFQQYIQKHSETLNSNELISFIRLLTANDEYTKMVLDKLWSEFSATYCTDERMRELFLKEMQELGIEVE